MKPVFLAICYGWLLLSSTLSAQTSLGSLQANTNPALPSSYNFQEYVFPEPNDQGNCNGFQNNSAQIKEVFLSQTHRHAIGHPFFFTIGYRPALLQLAIEGTGIAPDVQVEGIFNGTSLGTLCLSGPTQLSSFVDLSTPNFTDYFSVTLPKSWIQPGLELSLSAGNDTRTLSSSDLKIGPQTELNLVMVNMDVLDFNDEPHLYPAFQDFIQEVASAIPASVIRFGTFPVDMVFPELVATNNTEPLVRLGKVDDISVNGITDWGNINYVCSEFVENLMYSTGDFPNCVYFGNTLNLDPGGWGGGSAFVSFDYTDIFIHELGHALSLPHWEDEYNLSNPSDDEFSYPYGGPNNDAGSRGEAWNFIQDKYEFVDPICRSGSGILGVERSDCMQRENACLGRRSYGDGKWDGFGDFSAIAIHRYLMGAASQSGQVNYKGSPSNYHLKIEPGFPQVSLLNGQRYFGRHPLQPSNTENEDAIKLPGQEQLEQDVYLIYGTAHETQSQANIVYAPLKYQGTLLPILDPTDPLTFAVLQNLEKEEAPNLVYESRDLTLRLTYADGSILHALIPFHSYERAPYTWGFGLGRADVSNFALVVPGDQDLCNIQVYKRPFVIDEPTYDYPGNINYEPNNITAANFMDEAVLLSQYECSATTISAPDVLSFHVYPNPSEDFISIEISDYQGKSFSMLNSAGQLLSTGRLGQSSTSIDVSQIPTGIYSIVIYDPDSNLVATKRLLKQ